MGQEAAAQPGLLVLARTAQRAAGKGAAAQPALLARTAERAVGRTAAQPGLHNRHLLELLSGRWDGLLHNLDCLCCLL